MATNLIGPLCVLQGIVGCAAAAAAAADEGHLDRVVLGRVDMRHGDRGQGRRPGQASGVFQKLAS